MKNETNKSYKAVILGAAGIVGIKLVKQLLASDRCTHLTVVSRKPIPSHPKLTVEIWQDFSAFWRKQSSELSTIFAGADVLFCCVGAQPMFPFNGFLNRKKTAKMFQSVDYYYVVGSATIAHLASIPQLSVISSPDVKKSPLLISQVQWKMQEEVQNMGFPGVSIFQPDGLIDTIGHAGSTWKQLVNHLKIGIGYLFQGHQQAIKVEDMASAMKIEYELRLTGKISNTAVYRSDAIRELLQYNKLEVLEQ